MFFRHCSLRRTQRSLSFDENVRTEDGGKDKKGETALRLSSFSFSWSLALCHQSLPFCARLCAKNKASEEEEAALFMWNSASGSLSTLIQSPTFGQATRERLAKGDARVRGFARGFVANSRVLSWPASLSKKSGDIFVALSLNVSRVGTVLKSPWILEGVFEKSLKSTEIFFNLTDLVAWQVLF